MNNRRPYRVNLRYLDKY